MSHGPALTDAPEGEPTIDRNVFTFAFVSLELYPITAGGAGILLHHTVAALLRSGMRVVLYLDVNEREIEDFDLRCRHTYPNPDNLTFHDVGEIRRSLAFLGQVYSDSEQARSAAFAHAILTTQDQHTIDLIEFYDYCGPAFHYLSFNANRRRPVAIRFHNTVEIIQRGTRSAFSHSRLTGYSMERAQLSLADVVLVPGENFLRDEIQKLYSGELSHQNVAVSAPIRTPIGEIVYHGNSRNVLFYGRLSTFKGLDTFIIAAVLALRDAQFAGWINEFVVAGPEETVASALTLDEIRSFIPPDLLPKFRFVGRLRHSQLMTLLEDIAFACFANRMESFCYAAHELYSAGIPLILSDRAAFRDHFVPDDVVFCNCTASGLAAAMTDLAADPARLSALSARAHAKPSHTNVQSYFDAVGLAREAWERAAAKPTEGRDRDAVSIFILSNGDQVAEQRTLESLTDLSCSVHLLTLHPKGQVTFAGLRWNFSADDDLLRRVAAGCMFVRAGDICHAEAVLESALHMEADKRVGAIAFWHEIDGRIRCSHHAFVPEFAALTGPGLRTLIRTGDDLTVLELLRSNSVTDEASLLLAQRAQSRAVVEKPVVAVTITHAIALPPAETNFAVDYDRMSKEYLALSRDLVLPATFGTNERDGSHRAIPKSSDLLALRASLAFGEGELWVLRVFRHRAALHEPWTVVQRSDDWVLVTESQSPAGGALKTFQGELSFWADENYGIELLWGPFCSGAEIRFRECIYRLNLRTDHVTSSIIWLDELTHGLSQAPVPERLPITAIGETVVKQVTKAWIAEYMKPSIRRLVISVHRSDLTRPDSGAAVATLPELLGTDVASGADLAFAILAAMQTSEDCALYLPFAMTQAPQVADLLLQKRNIPIVIDAEGQQIGAFDHTFYPRLARWCGILEKHRADITVRSGNEAVLFALTARGAKSLKATCTLPLCPALSNADDSAIDLIVLPSDGLIDNIHHMVAGAAFATMMGVTIDTIYLQEGQWHAANISETLGAARNCATYTSLDRVLARPRNRPVIACAIYPEPIIPSHATRALSLGAPTIVGPVGQSKEFSDVLRDMSVIYWEDARDIGQAIVKLAANRVAIVHAYNSFVRAAKAIEHAL